MEQTNQLNINHSDIDSPPSCSVDTPGIPCTCSDGTISNVKYKHTICKDPAITWINNWQDFYTNKLSATNVQHGFYFPIEDLKDLSNLELSDGTKPDGVRAYFAIQNITHPPDTTIVQEFKAILVPVFDVDPIKNPGGNDIIQDLSTPPNSLIFDFTSPCPTMCAENNPLEING